MHIDTSQSPALFKLASERLHSIYRADWNMKVLTAISHRGIEAQALFTEIEPGIKCQLSVWTEKATGLRHGRCFVESIFQVAFKQWDCKRMHAVTREANEPAWRALMAMGFEFEVGLKAWFGEEEGWMFRMLRDDCRWLKGK